MNPIELVLFVAAVYLIVGVLFAAFFLRKPVGEVDEAARGALWTTRALWFPGVVALWPALAIIWRKNRRTP